MAGTAAVGQLPSLPGRQECLPHGLALNLLGVLLVVAAMYALGRLVFGIDLGELPDWAVKPRG